MNDDPVHEGRPVVALTGATGFIGHALRTHLMAAGYRVRALYRPRRGRVMQCADGLKWVAGDLADRDALAELVKGADAVIHCAGSVRGASRADFDRVNEAGVVDIVRAAENEPSVRRFLLISSLAAREAQLSDYAGSKRRGELALQAGAQRMTWTIIRPPAVYGPGDKEMLPMFRGMARGVAAIPGDGNGRFSMIHVADLASAVVAWLDSGRGVGATYELDDGHGGYDWPTVLGTAARVLRGGAPIRRLAIPVPVLRFVGRTNLMAARVFGYAPMLSPGKVREVTHADWSADSHAFSQDTGWRPAISFDRGLAETLGLSPQAVTGVPS
ncbi:NAD-dependent epimerase/dehydratase family protein [Luteibacter aegosomatissinici]|uniref:NAD-dependent epimerase/dehydratase family protein n=1 Tax=Luteibacter aegosomatissinici TaxID=2911539 RepID=UPI001FF92BEF|nr:NAD-dependent epimerase/dehydratase family protein [Luteibacter aegosomatissinici]UPG96517.1 NAD-dependent epimerase/dehydratase family protein [Luteibacter aegosomatissinici]